MSERERIEQAAKENGWTVKEFTKSFKIQHVSVSRNDTWGTLMAFRDTGDFLYADGAGINVASITVGAEPAISQVIAYLQQGGARS
ncbi:Uncharacterised protein [Mycobacteroides abscessus subsp. bolletii]|uniref:hypothetical protein n=1 Tax=Mycobacteroides abscessus TaxID=36809 RepID=UPI0009CC74C5|nr:hypothetical protein [Mycobacteroides abscessus]SKU53660.1 Uncharacterised protein [Mycobacteroides abscessus subsp. bolletii]